MPHLNSLAREFATKARFVFVYIREAHAKDVWPISSARFAHDGKPVQVDTPRSDHERCSLAAQFVRDYQVGIPVLVDAVQGGDQFEREYAPWPIRYYVLVRDSVGVVRVSMKAQPQGAAYDLGAVRNHLLGCVAR